MPSTMSASTALTEIADVTPCDFCKNQASVNMLGRHLVSGPYVESGMTWRGDGSTQLSAGTLNDLYRLPDVERHALRRVERAGLNRI